MEKIVLSGSKLNLERFLKVNKGYISKWGIGVDSYNNDSWTMCQDDLTKDNKKTKRGRPFKR